MAGYTITITPNDEEAGACTTIRVDTTSGGARITELTVRAAEGGTIYPQQIPALNLDQLIAALVPPATAAIPAVPAQRVPEVAAPEIAAAFAAPVVAARDASSAPADLAEGTVESAQPVAPPARASRSSRAKKAGRTAPAKKAPARTRVTKAERSGTTAQSASGRRAYRRMPEPDALLAAYREVGGTTALARHYGVPRHTATGWLRRLRNQGLLES